ncbi:hypothetical protein K4F52_010187 [Lecanicillium sp. MT-2017a]|nr:hypothetical protein K4F52_010187 [Lecanicillium sp. MT-2017a]
MAPSSDNDLDKFNNFMNSIDSHILGEFGVADPNSIGVHAGAFAPRTIQHYAVPSLAASQDAGADSNSRARQPAGPAAPMPAGTAIQAYAPSIVMSEDEYAGGVKPIRRGRPRYQPSEAGDSVYSAVQPPSVFSDGNWTGTSISSVPSRGTVAPSEADTQQDEEPANPEDLIRLPCEFIAYANCGLEYRLGEVDDWIRHISVDHLHSILPRTAVCWFCDRSHGRYDVQDDGEISQQRLEEHFRSRMLHIAEHFRAGMTVPNMRPDFAFLDHIHDNGFISEDMFQIAKAYSEVKNPELVTFNDIPFKKVKQDREIHVERRSRNGNREPRLQVVRE